MYVIAVIGQKGGTGKTTLTLGLAVAALNAGMAAAVLDLDPQANAWNWKKRRGMENDPAVKATSPGALILLSLYRSRLSYWLPWGVSRS